MDRVRIGAAHQSQCGDVVRRHHTGVRRVELLAPATARELGNDLIDALGNDQYRPVG